MENRKSVRCGNGHRSLKSNAIIRYLIPLAYFDFRLSFISAIITPDITTLTIFND